MINLGNRSCRFNISKGIVFITQNSLQQFSPQFLDTMTPVVFYEKITESDIYKTQQTINQDEEKELRILSEYAGVDILDSQEITEQLVFISEIFLTNMKGNL
uniref:Uncharacterized protein n=1 Tax=Panagrolaimus sp. PS1159 TaxID=55785 RepID=A0AC35ES35_9BILA